LRAIETLTPGEKISVHNIDITPLEVEHSAKGAVMYLIEADDKKVLYSGDFNDIPEESFDSIKSLGEIDVMLCEGTNIEVEKEETERNVSEAAAEYMKTTKGPVFVLCSTTNINRIKAIEEACIESKRILAIDPFMKAILKVVGYKPAIRKFGFLSYFIKPGHNPRMEKYVYQKNMDKPVIYGYYGYEDAAGKAKETDVTFMIRQSMSRFLSGLNKYISLKGSTLIYSIWTGYKKSKYTADFLNTCTKLGMNIVDLHVSGHAYKRQLESAVKRIAPKTLIPVHTENEAAFMELKGVTVKPLENNEEFQIL